MEATGNCTTVPTLNCSWSGTILPEIMSGPRRVAGASCRALLPTTTLAPVAAVNWKVYTVQSAANGSWSPPLPNALGNDPVYDRTMHYATILPTEQISSLEEATMTSMGPSSHHFCSHPMGTAASLRPSSRPCSDRTTPISQWRPVAPNTVARSISGNTVRALVQPNQIDSCGPF